MCSDKLYGDLDQLKQQVTEAEARYTHLTLRAADTEARAAGAEGYTRDLKEALTRSKARIVELAKVCVSVSVCVCVCVRIATHACSEPCSLSTGAAIADVV